MPHVDIVSEPSGTRARPARHFTPEAHWINDPNGLIVVDGTYHLFFQHNPDASRWGNLHWGHARSNDLVHWEQLPIAIPPDEHGLAFSGSVVVDTENTAGFGAGALVAVYTQDLDHLERQSLAYSLDAGVTWARYEHNPILDAPSGEPDFRDPKVLRYSDETGSWWVMVIALGSDIALYRSDDLKSWVPTSRLSVPWPWTDSIAEVPDLVRVPVRGTDDWVWTLIVSVIPGTAARRARVRYLPVDFDGTTIRPWSPDVVPEPVDVGPALYAPMVWDCSPDPPVLIGWFDESGLDETTAANSTGPLWCGRMSLPRRLSYSRSETPGPSNTSSPTTPLVLGPLVLAQEPIAGAFEPSIVIGPAADGNAGAERDTSTVVDAACFRIDVAAELSTSDRIHIRLAGQRSTVEIEVSAHGVSVDGDGLIGDDVGAEHATGHASGIGTTDDTLVPPGRTMTGVAAIVDAGSVEVFSDDGHWVWSAVCDLGLTSTSLSTSLHRDDTDGPKPNPATATVTATVTVAIAAGIVTTG